MDLFGLFVCLVIIFIIYCALRIYLGLSQIVEIDKTENEVVFKFLFSSVRMKVRDIQAIHKCEVYGAIGTRTAQTPNQMTGYRYEFVTKTRTIIMRDVDIDVLDYIKFQDPWIQIIEPDESVWAKKLDS